jgi:HAD superfamily hydrolase (TIGR01450 family)
MAGASSRTGAPVKLPAVPITPLIARYDHILLDLDGCVWVGDQPTPGAVDAVAALRAAGKGVAFVTNDSQLLTEEYVRKLWRLGFRASVEEVVTVGGALQFVLAERFSGRAAVVIGSSALHRHVEAAGLRIVNGTTFASRADVVVVAFHRAFDYDELREATQAALRGAFLVGSNRDATFPQPDGLWPGSGAIIAAVETASGRTVVTVGKPEPTLVQTALDRLGPGRALMIGDRVDADLGAAHAAGIDGAIVLTGASDREIAEAAGDPSPVGIAERLATMVLG